MTPSQAKTSPVTTLMQYLSRTGFAHYASLLLVVLSLSLIGIYWRPLEQLSTLWPANAILLGLFLRIPSLVSPAGWLVAATGYIAADLITGNSLLMAVLLNGTNLLSVCVALNLCLRHSEAEPHLLSPGSLPNLFLAMVTASVVAGLAGGLLLWKLMGEPLWSSVANWVVSELLAYIILLPSVLSAPALSSWKRHRQLTGLSSASIRKIIAAICLLAVLAASVWIGGPGVVAFPVSALLVCALTCGLFLTSLLTLLFSMWTLLGTTFGSIPLMFDVSDSSALLSMRLGVASVALAPIVVASVMASRDKSLLALRQLAEYDALTGLLNRRAFYQRAADQLAMLKDHQKPAAMLVIDIDHFKQINDTYGHAVGDEALSRAGKILRRSVRSADTCGRLGGEEFALLIPECTQELLETLASRIHQAIREEPVTLDKAQGAVLKMTVSIGATLSRGPSDDLRALLRRADQAMYAAKQGGRNQTRFF